MPEGNDVLVARLSRLKGNMLKQRVITAVLLLPVVIGSILLLSLEFFTLVWAAVMSVAAYEWLKLSGIQNRWLLLLSLIMLNGLFALIWFYPFSSMPVAWYILIAWFLIIMSFMGDPVASLKRCRPVAYSFIGIAVGLVLIFPTWLAMVLLHQHNPWMVLHVFLIVWVADTGAYFSGRRFGKHKLAPVISPGKSWQGVWGALIAVTGYAIAISFFWQQGEQQQWLFVFICVLAALVSVAGDLLESVFKRVRGVKDSGQILPGHGGVMDRLDSMMAAAPVFTAGYYLAGWL